MAGQCPGPLPDVTLPLGQCDATLPLLGPPPQVEAAVEAKLRGPHAFPLERLLQIFFAIYADHDADDEDEDDQGGRDPEEVRSLSLGWWLAAGHS